MGGVGNIILFIYNIGILKNKIFYKIFLKNNKNLYKDNLFKEL